MKTDREINADQSSWWQVLIFFIHFPRWKLEMTWFTNTMSPISNEPCGKRKGLEHFKSGKRIQPHTKKTWNKQAIRYLKSWKRLCLEQWLCICPQASVINQECSKNMPSSKCLSVLNTCGCWVARIEHALKREFVLAAETSGFRCDFSLPLALSS